MQSSPATMIPRRRRCATSTSLAITSFGCLTRRSPDVRVKTSATGSPENDETPDQVDRDREIERTPPASRARHSPRNPDRNVLVLNKTAAALNLGVRTRVKPPG